MLRQPEFARTCVIIFLFLAVVSILSTWSREQIKVHDGQIASDTRITRLDYQVIDIDATEAKREEARNSSPRIYTINVGFNERLEASILGLPVAVVGMQSLDEVSDELREQFQLTEISLASLQGMAVNGDATSTWKGSVSRLVRDLQRRSPL